MIKSFEINNFRCFHTSEAKGLTRINLFGGRNNAGKTSMLEAVLLMGKPSPSIILDLFSYRKMNLASLLSNPTKLWNFFFFEQKNETEIEFKFILNDEPSINKISMRTYEEEEDLNDLLVMTQKDIDDNALNQHLFSENSIKSTLRLTTSIDDHVLNEATIEVSSLKNKPKINNHSAFYHQFREVVYLPSGSRNATTALAKDFDKSKIEGQSENLLKAFRIIDPSIEKVETLNVGEPELYFKRKDENYIPLSLCGDAMYKIANFILKIVNNPNSILLIDEIENGIHYENQEEIWTMLFDLCKEFNVQIFATTHSGEMIEAFKNVIVQNELEEEGAYFEMARHINTDEILIRKLPTYVLENRLEKHKPLRGELTNKRGNINL